uniref:Glycosyltransferase n=1 Tax=Desulfovibrio sp. U5L TaxID=596152 RepID=I2Q7I9_9BACT
MQRDIVMMILTSSIKHYENFHIFLRLLMSTTDFQRFTKIYFLCNAISEEQLAILYSIKRKHSNIQVILEEDPGYVQVFKMENFVLKKHADAVIIKIDDDTYLTWGWLEKMLQAYEDHAGPTFGFLQPLIPINHMGVEILWDYFDEHYRKEFRAVITEEALKHIFPALQHWIWRKILDNSLVDNYLATINKNNRLHYYDHDYSMCSINFLLFDGNLTNAVYPFRFNDDQGNILGDENQVNIALKRHRFEGIVVKDCIVHHFCYNNAYLRLAGALCFNNILKHIEAFNASRAASCPQRRKMP